MVIYYKVISKPYMDIDFDVIFKYVKDTLKSNDLKLIKEDFIDNIEGYLWNIYQLTDFVEDKRKEWHESNSNDILEEVGKRVTKELLFK